ncbi:MAG: hypothetical protein J6129_01090, partial [Bacteroidaceae bacterium]|nr:hypothetical protein [Bacteroidaceae bacterium]
KRQLKVVHGKTEYGFAVSGRGTREPFSLSLTVTLAFVSLNSVLVRLVPIYHRFAVTKISNKPF